MRKYSSLIILLSLAFVLSTFSYLVWQKEQLLKTGEQALIPLAPVDPRSLMQGDYMILNYTIPSAVNTLAKKQRKGLLVYTLNQHKIMTLLRVADENEKLQTGEKLIKFRYRNRRVQLSANSFFFQEGNAELFEQAEFADVRIDQYGNVILVGLYNEKYQLLGKSSGLE